MPRLTRSKPEPSDIEKNTIHLWTWNLGLPTDNVESNIHSYLTENEKTRAENFRFEKDRIRYLRSHYMLRVLIKFYSGPEAALHEFTTNQYGKPYIEGSALDFNISHSGNIVIVAFGINTPLGVDVEKKRSDIDFMGVGKRFFTTKEFSELQSEEDPVDCFYRLWTGKEAIVKAIGQGLSVDLKSFSLPLKNTDSHTVTWTDTCGTILKYDLVDFSINAAYSAALAYEKDSREISIRRIRRYDFAAFRAEQNL